MELTFKLGKNDNQQVNLLKKSDGGDFPGGPGVKNLPASAGRHSLDPCSREMPYAAGQLSPCAAITRPTTLEPMSHWSKPTGSNEGLVQPRIKK